MTIHKRHPEFRYMSLCGMGYSWPSGIALRDNERSDEVTCKKCLALMEEKK